MKRVGYVFSYCEKSYIDEQKKILRQHKLDTIVIEEKNLDKKTDDVLQEVISVLTPGDQLVIYELCCLGKTITQLPDTLELLLAKKIQLVILDNDLSLGNIDNRLFLELVMKIALSEKKLVRERTKKGLADARRNGKTGGRPKISEETIKKIRFLYHNNTLTLREIAEKCDVSLGTAYKYIQK